MVFLSNYLVFKIVLAALGRTDYPVAGDLELKYDNVNKIYLSGGSLKYIDDATLWTTIGDETRDHNILYNKLIKTTTTAYETNLPSASVHGTFGINQDATRYVHQSPVANGYQNGKIAFYSGTPSTGYTAYGSEITSFSADVVLCSMSADGKYALVTTYNGGNDGYKMYKDTGSGYAYHSSYSFIGSHTSSGYTPAFVPSNNNFVITGTNNNTTWYFKLYVYDSATDTWTGKATIQPSGSSTADGQRGQFGKGFTYDGSYFFQSNNGATTRGEVWSVDWDANTMTYKWHTTEGNNGDGAGGAISPDNKYVVLARHDGSVYRVYENTSGDWSTVTNVSSSFDLTGSGTSTVFGTYAIQFSGYSKDNTTPLYIGQASGFYGDGKFRIENWSSPDVRKVYINEPGKYSVDANIAGLKYKTNEVEVTGSITPYTKYKSTVQKLYPSDGGTVSDSDYYGYVGLSGNGLVMVIVGKGDDDGGTDKGGFMVYEKVDGVWTFTQQITGVGSGSGTLGLSEEGKAVQLDYTGTRVFIGAHADDHTHNNSGSVYIYKRVAQGNWTLEQRIDGGGSAYRYGYNDVNNDGDKLIIGSYGYSSNTGRAWYYTRSGTTWSLQQQLAAPSTSAYGTAVAMNSAGTRAIIGGYSHSSTKGRADIWNYSSGSWSIGAGFTGVSSSDFFGWNVDMSNDGNTVVVGAPLYSNGGEEGRAYIYTTSDGTNWSLLETLSNQDNNEWFGFSVQISGDGNTVVIGAGKNDDGLTDRGKSYVYVKSGGSWPSTPTYTILGTTANANNGYTLGISDTADVIISGAPFDDDKGTDRGAVYVYEKAIVAELKFDGSNKLSIGNAPTNASSKLVFGSNVYDIGALTSDLTIETPGVYKSLTYDTGSDAAYFSKVTVASVSESVVIDRYLTIDTPVTKFTTTLDIASNTKSISYGTWMNFSYRATSGYTRGFITPTSGSNPLSNTQGYFWDFLSYIVNPADGIFFRNSGDSTFLSFTRDGGDEVPEFMAAQGRGQGHNSFQHVAIVSEDDDGTYYATLYVNGDKIARKSVSSSSYNQFAVRNLTMGKVAYGGSSIAPTSFYRPFLYDGTLSDDDVKKVFLGNVPKVSGSGAKLKCYFPEGLKDVSGNGNDLVAYDTATSNFTNHRVVTAGVTPNMDNIMTCNPLTGNGEHTMNVYFDNKMFEVTAGSREHSSSGIGMHFGVANTFDPRKSSNTRGWTTSAVSSYGGFPHYLTVKFPEAKYVSNCFIIEADPNGSVHRTSSNELITGFTIDASTDGTSWSTKYTSSSGIGNSGKQFDLTTPGTFQYWRLGITGSSVNYFGIGFWDIISNNFSVDGPSATSLAKFSSDLTSAPTSASTTGTITYTSEGAKHAYASSLVFPFTVDTNDTFSVSFIAKGMNPHQSGFVRSTANNNAPEMEGVLAGDGTNFWVRPCNFGIQQDRGKSPGYMNNSDWTHYVYTLSPCGFNLYINGVLRLAKVFDSARSGTTGITTFNVNTTNMFYADGILGKFKAFSNVLDYHQVTELYHADTPGISDLLVQPDPITFDGYNKLTLSGLTNPTSKIHALPTGAETTTTYDIGTATNIYIDSAGTYTAEMKGSDGFALDSNVVSAISSEDPIRLHWNAYSSPASDSSGNSLTGTLNSVSDTSGAFTFNGSSSYIQLSTSNASDAKLQLAIWDISCEFYKTGSGGSLGWWIDTSAMVLITKGMNGADGLGYDINYGLVIDTNNKIKTGFEEAGSNQIALVGTTTISNNQWYTARSTFDGTILKVYLNGVLENSVTTALVPASNDAGPLMVGAGRYNTSSNIVSYFQGRIKNVKINKFIKNPPKLTFDGFNKYTFADADTGSTYKLKYGSNTYDLGTTSTAYIKDAGTYSAEIKGATNFALSSNVVSGTIPPYKTILKIQDILGYTSNEQFGFNDYEGTGCLAFSKDGTRLAVGAWMYSSQKGRVYIYTLSGGQYVLDSGMPLEGGSGQHMGYAINFNDDGTKIGLGSANGLGAKVYERSSSGSWSLRDSFGSGSYWTKGVVLDTSGDRALGGASGDNTLKLFDWNGSSAYTETTTFSGSSNFGNGFDMTRDGLTVMGINKPSSGNETVKAWKYASGSWSQMGSDIDVGAVTNMVHMARGTGTRFVVSNHSNNSSTGIVKLYEYSGSSWSKIKEWTGYTSGVGLGIDHSISDDGTIIIAGAYTDDTGSSGNDAGMFSIFTEKNGTWEEKRFTGDTDNDQLGYGVTMSYDGSFYVASAPNNDEAFSNAGKVRIYQNKNVLDFDGYNKLTLSGLDTDATSNVTLDGNTYSIGSATNIYIEDTGTYDAESKSASTFALTSKVVGTISSIVSPLLHLDFESGGLVSTGLNTTQYKYGSSSLYRNDSSVTVSNDGSYNIGNTSSAKATIMLWVRPESYPSYNGNANRIVVAAEGRSESSASSKKWAIALREHSSIDEVWQFHYPNSSNTNRVVSYTPSDVPVGTWYHVCVTIESGSLKFYIDGDEVTSSLTGNKSDIESEWAGFNDDEGFKFCKTDANYLKGWVDDFKLFNSVLTLSEITSHMNASKLTSPSLTHDGYKLVVSGITPTSSTLKYESNTYDIGSATNVYIKDVGTYTAESKSATDFAFTSNVVSGTVKTIEPALMGGHHGAHALTYDGKLYAWGRNTAGAGELGVGDANNRSVPTLCTGITQGQVAKFLDFDGLTHRSYMRWVKTTDNKIYATGRADYNQIPGHTSDLTTFTDITSHFGDQSLSANNIIQVSTGARACAGLTETGNVWTWGQNDGTRGNLGNGGTTSSTQAVPAQITINGATDNITKLANGHDFTIALDNTGDVWLWGTEWIGSTWGSASPIKMGTALDSITITDISASYSSMYAISNTGVLYASGKGGGGQIMDGGNNNVSSSSNPDWKEVTYFSSNNITVNKVYPGSQYVGGGYVDTSDGWYAFGENVDGTLGLGDTSVKLSPVKFTCVSNIKKIAVGYSTSHAVTEDGKYYAWGDGYAEARGDSDASDISYPKYIDTLPNILAPSFEFDGYDKVFVNKVNTDTEKYKFNIPSVIKLTGGTWDNQTLNTGTSSTSTKRFYSLNGTSSVDTVFTLDITTGILTYAVNSSDTGGGSPTAWSKVGFNTSNSSDGDSINAGDTIYLVQSSGSVNNGYFTVGADWVTKIQDNVKYTKGTTTYDAGKASIVTVSDPGTYDAQIQTDENFTLKSATVPATKASGLYTWAFHHGNFDNAYGDGDILTARDNGRFYADTPAYTGDIGTITPGPGTSNIFGFPLTSSIPSASDYSDVSTITQGAHCEINSGSLKATNSSSSANDRTLYFHTAADYEEFSVTFDFNLSETGSDTGVFFSAEDTASDMRVEVQKSASNTIRAEIQSSLQPNFTQTSGFSDWAKLTLECFNKTSSRSGRVKIYINDDLKLDQEATTWTTSDLKFKYFTLVGGRPDGRWALPNARMKNFKFYNHRLHDTVSSTTYTFEPPSGGLTANVLMVAGGAGGGGRAEAGGGGAGGLVYTAGTSLAQGATKTIVVGNGDSGGIGSGGGDAVGFSGKDTTFTDLTPDAIGGGGGGSQTNGPNSGGSGGGGNGGDGSNYNWNTGASGTSSQGNAGGNGANTLEGGGGGGAGGVGANASSGNAGDGGIGKFFGTGSSFTNFGDEYGEGGWFAGGGGGGNRNEDEIIPGGRGGGGYGQSYNGYMGMGCSSHGMVHTGGGGGGAGTQARDYHTGYNTEGEGGVRGHGGRGGSGIVLIQTNVAPPNGANTAVVQVGNPRRRSLPPAVDYTGSEVNRFYIIDGASMPTYMLPTHWYAEKNTSSSTNVPVSQGSHSLQKRADGGTSNVWYQTSYTYFADYGTNMAQTVDAVFMPLEQQRYNVLLSIGANSTHDIQLEMAADGTANLYMGNGAYLAYGTIKCFTAGKWHHIALTVDSEHNAVGYVNGHPVVSVTYTGNPDVGSRGGNMHFRTGVASVTFRKFLLYEVSAYNFHMSPKQVLQRAAEVGLGPKLEYDGLNTLKILNTEPGSTVRLFTSNVADTSNVYIVADPAAGEYTIPEAGKYYAEIKGTDTFTVTKTLDVSGTFPLYQYPPIDGTTSSLTEATAANSFNNIWTISGAASGNGMYQVRCNTPADNVDAGCNHYDAWRNNVGSTNQWQTLTTATYPITFTILLPSAKTIRKYRMFPLDHNNPNGSGTSATPGTSVNPTLSGNGGDDATKRPKSWVIRGSNNDSDWTDLDTVTNKPISIYGDVYSIDSPASYQYYQVSITANNGGNRLLIGDIQLWGDA